MKKFLLFSLLLTACATTTSSNPGFLDDYSILEPNPDVPDSERWISHKAGQYDRIIVEPFVAYFHYNVYGKPVDANELDDLLTRLRGFVIDALTEDSLLETESGPGVMRLEVAVTDLHEEAGKGSGLGLENANIEMRATDSMTGTLVAAAVFRARFDQIDLAATGDDKWAPARAGAKRWAARLKAGLDAARAR
ncbi:MAG: DUF3313 family protein [Planctomycetota bacterium]|nr:DUF3313 family protein [Planctomycetota bacterium]